MKLSGAVIGLLLTFVIFTSTAIAQNKGNFIGYDETKGLFSGVTFIHYDRGHGTQVEFMSKQGRTYLLYPGNAAVVRGDWKLTRSDQPNVFNLCFRYPTNSYNPVTKHTGGGWECQPAGFALLNVVDSKAGDVLGLAKVKQVPFALSRKKASFSELLRKLK